jgi:hypothetical protein
VLLNIISLTCFFSSFPVFIQINETKIYFGIFNCFVFDDASYEWIRNIHFHWPCLDLNNQFGLMMIIIMNTYIYMNNRSFFILRCFFFLLSSTSDSSKEFVPNRRATLVMRGYISEDIYVSAKNFTIVHAFFLFAQLSPPPPTIFLQLLFIRFLLLLICRFFSFFFCFSSMVMYYSATDILVCSLFSTFVFLFVYY